MLEAFQSLREELTAKKQTEVDQTSFLASKPGTSSTAVKVKVSNTWQKVVSVQVWPSIPHRFRCHKSQRPILDTACPSSFPSSCGKKQPKSARDLAPDMLGCIMSHQGGASDSKFSYAVF